MVNEARPTAPLPQPQDCALEEQTLGQLGGAVKQSVVEDGVFVVDAGARPDDGFALLGGIPGKADLRSELGVGLIDWVAQSRSELIQQRSAAAAGSVRQSPAATTEHGIEARSLSERPVSRL